MEETLELWKDIDLSPWGGENYTGYYKISNFGKVKTISREVCFGKQQRFVPEKLRIGEIKENGYLRLILCKNNKLKNYYVHRLVALHFINNKENLYQVNHKDGNKSNNKVCNLEWCTQSYNMQHAWDTGLCDSSRAGLSKRFREYATSLKHKILKSYKIIKYDKEYNKIETFLSLRDVHKTGIDRYTLSKKFKTAVNNFCFYKGFYWEKLENNDKRVIDITI